MGEPGSRDWFEAYLAAFNADDFAGFGAYYAGDVAFHGQAATLTGREAILDFYRDVKTRLEENLELLSFVGSPDRVAAEDRTSLRPYEDWLDFPTGPLKAGELRQSVNFAFYDIADGKFTRIRSARFARIS
jgi:hypothetical protein